MSDKSFANGKRVAKNTGLLYIRMMAVMIVSFITIKYTLKLLGNEDYGIVNVVGGVVAFMETVTTTISLATNRFLAFNLGERDAKKYNDTFNMLLLIFIVTAVLIFIILEAISYPMAYNWLVIPDTRRYAAFIVYHLSTLTFVAKVINIPFTSSILANEKMGVYAYVTIVETVSRLLVLVVLVLTPYDRLVVYSLCTLLITIVTSAVYYIYNSRKIENTRLYFHWDRQLWHQLVGYTGWSLFATFSYVLCTHGLTILMNLFFGVAVNAAKAFSDRIKNIIYSFVKNFYAAVSPQITKTYAAGEHENTIKLAYSSTRLAFYLMMLLSVPAIVLMHDLLHLWLGENCSEDMVLFTRLLLIFALVTVFETPITFMVRATGQIKIYQIFVGVFTLSIVPVSYVLFKSGYPAYSAFIVEIVIYAIVQFVRIHVAKRYYAITIWEYVVEVLAMPLSIVAITSSIAVAVLYATANAWIACFVSVAALCASVWRLGLKTHEKTMITKFVVSKLESFKNKR